MISIQRSNDRDLVASLLTHPDIWASGGDDGTGDPEGFEPGFHDQLYYLVPWRNDEPMGIFLVTPSNSTTFEWHTGILRDHRGAPGIASCLAAMAWMAEHTAARKLITWVDTEARHVYLYAKAVGFGVEGVSHGSLLKDGRLHDQYLMGKLLCQSQQ